MADVAVKKGQIEAVSDKILPRPGDRVLDFSNCYLVPGFVDVHVHLREPGFVYKETIATGTAAAARGGYTTVCAMPNLSPAPDTLKNLKVELKAIQKDAKIEVLPYGCITMDQRGRGQLADFTALAPYVCAFSDDGKGVQDEGLMELAMMAVRRTGCPYHVCHVSAKETVAAIRAAKRLGVNVTCETAPHYLLLTDSDLQEDGRFKMNPPIREAADRDALIEGLLDGTIDMIVTDHAPHSFDEKAKGLEGSAMGVVGLECAFRVLHDRLIRSQKVLSLEKLVELMSLNPRKRFNIPGGIEPGQRADIAVIDPDKRGTIDPRHFFSMGTATPFDGWETTGDVVMTMAGGKIAYQGNGGALPRTPPGY